MVVLIVVGLVIIGWLFAGGITYHVSGGSSAAVTPARPDCLSCARLDAWWSTLDWWGKILGAAWYAAEKLVCVLKGC